MTTYTITDAREAGFCVEGIREFCEKHNVPFRDFIRNGVTDDFLIEVGEAGVLEKLEEARRGSFA